MADLVEKLQEIERRAHDARRVIAAGRKTGLPVNGTTALRDIEMAARDLIADLQKADGRPEDRPSQRLPRVAARKGA